MQETPPPPVLSLTVDPTGTFDAASRGATVSGTVTCTGTADFAGINGTLTQTVGRFTIRQVRRGLATVQAFAFACNASGCGQDSVSQQVRLRKG